MNFYGHNPGGGRLYGPTASGILYLSSPAHRARNRPHKNRWSCTEPEESDCFEVSETHAWLDAAMNWWWVGANGKTVIGKKGERLAFFPVRSNGSDPAHGYPVSLLQDPDYRIPDALVDIWKKNKLIDGISAKRIKGRKI